MKAIAGLIVIITLAPALAHAWGYDYYDYYNPYGYYAYDYGYDAQDYYSYYTYSSYSHPTYSSYAPQYTSAPTPYARSYPTGDRDFFGTPICYWEGYGRADCGSNPRQPVYDIWTGTWY